MAKQLNKKPAISKEEKKSPKEASALFYNIIKASVAGNPAPKPVKPPKKIIRLMKYILSTMLLFSVLTGFSQKDTVTYGYVNDTLIRAEIMPYCMWMSNSNKFSYNKIDLQKSSGKEIIEFLVDIDGKASNYVIINSINSDMDKEAIRLVKKSGIWSPAVQNGNRVKFRVRVAILNPE